VTAADDPHIPPPNGIVLTLPHLHRAAAVKLRTDNNPIAAELAEAHDGAASLLQQRPESVRGALSNERPLTFFAWPHVHLSSGRPVIDADPIRVFAPHSLLSAGDVRFAIAGLFGQRCHCLPRALP
jgi:hypothetical protein